MPALTPSRFKPWLAPLVALAFGLPILALLYAWLPYASGYGAYRVTALHFAKVVWSDGDNWQHCYLVPFAVLFILYYDRKKLALLPVTNSWTGLLVVLAGLFVYWVGFRADNIYLGYASFQIFMAGLILWLLGWKWMLGLVFPWAFLVFLYPLPFMDNFVAFPLRLIMSQLSVDVLNIIGIPTIKSGTAIVSASDALSGLKSGARFQVDVADPCSGIHSLFALMMVTALWAYIAQKGLWRKIALFLCSAPLAILGNLVRILMLTIGTLVLGTDTAIGSLEHPSFFHEMAGYIVFVVALGGMWGVSALLEINWVARWHRLRSDLPGLTPASASPEDPTKPPPPPRPRDEY